MKEIAEGDSGGCRRMTTRCGLEMGSASRLLEEVLDKISYVRSVQIFGRSSKDVALS